MIRPYEFENCDNAGGGQPNTGASSKLSAGHGFTAHIIAKSTYQHGARFLNEWGRDLRVERTLDTAYWLDIWCGWRGTTLDRRYLRAREFREAAA